MQTANWSKKNKIVVKDVHLLGGGGIATFEFVMGLFNFTIPANLTEFLLEKSRVVSQGEGELNFHIFYWMFSGISLEEANLYQLQDISKHRS